MWDILIPYLFQSLFIECFSTFPETRDMLLMISDSGTSCLNTDLLLDQIQNTWPINNKGLKILSQSIYLWCGQFVIIESIPPEKKNIPETASFYLPWKLSFYQRLRVTVKYTSSRHGLNFLCHFSPPNGAQTELWLTLVCTLTSLISWYIMSYFQCLHMFTRC